MTIKEAASFLGVIRQDDAKTIKQKFRKMIGQYHPDAVGSDEPEYIKKAQLINEAYSILRENVMQGKKKSESGSIGITGKNRASEWYLS